LLALAAFLSHLLLASGASAKWRDQSDELPGTGSPISGPVLIAAGVAAVGFIAYLVSKANKSTKDDSQRNTVDDALIEAAEKGDEGALASLLTQGADPNATNSYGNSALMFSVLRGHEQNVRVLLAAGAEPTWRNLQGDTAVDWAEKKGFTRIVDLLKTAVASTEARPKTHVSGRATVAEDY